MYSVNLDKLITTATQPHRVLHASRGRLWRSRVQHNVRYAQQAHIQTRDRLGAQIVHLGQPTLMRIPQAHVLIVMPVGMRTIPGQSTALTVLLTCTATSALRQLLTAEQNGE